MDRGRGRGMLMLMLLQMLCECFRLERKPPVTAGLIAANTLLYLRPKVLDPVLPPINQSLFNPSLILEHKDLKRFLLSAFHHSRERPLIYNLSLLWKGIELEDTMGNMKFAAMVTTLLGMSQGIALLLAKTLLFLNYEYAYYTEYAVGFSGVLFAMKVIRYVRFENYAYVYGLKFPARYAAWAELILIQMFMPGVSCLGHLGGILASSLFLYLKGHILVRNHWLELQ